MTGEEVRKIAESEGKEPGHPGKTTAPEPGIPPVFEKRNQSGARQLQFPVYSWAPPSAGQRGDSANLASFYSSPSQRRCCPCAPCPSPNRIQS